jgi:phage tail tube protein FII
MQNLYVMEAVDVRRADVVGDSRALTIGKLALPAIKHKNASHSPGGGLGEVKFVFPQIDPIEPKMELKGIDPSIIEGLGFTGGRFDKWVFAGAIRDKRTGLAIPSRAIIRGVISEWENDEFSPGEIAGCNHMMNEVTHYEFHLNGEELWYWDFYERELRIRGTSIANDVRRALGG